MKEPIMTNVGYWSHTWQILLLNRINTGSLAIWLLCSRCDLFLTKIRLTFTCTHDGGEQ